MLNLHQLERLLDDNQYRQLVDRILASGRATDPSLRSALTQQPVLVPVALGLALQRAGELSYGVSELAGRIVTRLLDLQLPDGRFGSERSGPRETIIASAVALHGLLDYQQQQGFFSPLSPRERAGVRVFPESKPVEPPTRSTPSSLLTAHLSSQSLAAAVERTVGALAAAVAGEVAALSPSPDSSDGHPDDLLPLRVVAWQLASHRAIASRLKLPQFAVAQLDANSPTRTRPQPPTQQALAA